MDTNTHGRAKFVFKPSYFSEKSPSELRTAGTRNSGGNMNVYIYTALYIYIVVVLPSAITRTLEISYATQLRIRTGAKRSTITHSPII